MSYDITIFEYLLAETMIRKNVDIYCKPFICSNKQNHNNCHLILRTQHSYRGSKYCYRKIILLRGSFNKFYLLLQNIVTSLHGKS